MGDTDSAGFETLLEHLKTVRGFDFSGYKRPSLTRRVTHRMDLVGIAGFDEYLDYLEVHPEEFTPLFNTILINVTGFFRDPAVWQFVREQVAPKLVARRANVDIRVWTAGCASGEEPYTVAMILADVLGLAAFGEHVKIYATDVDDEALTYARAATYSEREVAGVPPEFLPVYFEASGANYTISKELRRGVIFGRHDLVQDAPISKVDLLTCRNTLMYFNAETQSRVAQRFHFALRPESYLVLGKAEMLLSNGLLFNPVDLKRRIFSAAVADERPAGAGDQTAGTTAVVSALRPDVRDSAIEQHPAAEVILDVDGTVVAVNEIARATFGLDRQDVGRRFHDLELSYRPLELRSRIEQVMADRHPLKISEVPFTSHDGTIFLDVRVVPLIAGTGDVAVAGAALTFTDVSAAKRLQQELETANRELEDAYEELQSTNEELETTNEELQSTVEELETTNEELQSTNEELETMNEELHATNEELQAINDELNDRTTEVHRVNAFLESILRSFGGGIAVVDSELRVQMWNGGAEELWGVRRTEAVGYGLLSLDIGLPVEQLAGPVRDALADGQTRDVTLIATNRRGRAITCDVTVTPVPSVNGSTEGIILLMQQQR